METLFNTDLSSLDRIQDAILDIHDVRLFVKRDDKIDQDVSGNKWRKLKYNVLQCIQQKNSGILTFGGAFSNHLVATASACKKAGIQSVGVVRGDELNENSNETLQKCSEYGMKLHFVSREEYHLRNERYYHEELLNDFPNLLVVPEGGANYHGMVGCQELVKEIGIEFDQIIMAQGTTTTSCGVLMGLNANQSLTAVPVLKGFDSREEMRQLYRKSGIDQESIDSFISQLEILDQYHFGGYAKFNDQLLDFIKEFHQSYGIKLDPIYTGKAMFALWESIKSGIYNGQTIVFLHTGGLQGVKGVESKIGRKIFD